MDSSALTESRYNVILSILQKIAIKEGITNPKIDIIKGCEKGDGYGGEKSIAIVKGDNKTLELFIKGAPTNPAIKQAMDLRPIYMLEILFYQDIYPTFNEFQTRKNIPKPFTSVIGCVDTCTEIDNELLILQNARNLGFELWDRKKQMNPEHTAFVFTEYGKFHGLSYALKDQEPKVFQDLVGRFYANGFEILARLVLDACIKLAENVKSQFDPSKEASVYTSYCKFVGSMREFFVKLQHDDENKYKVITHGDCWCNNMMFKYAPNSNKTTPERMCLLDFQIIGHASPVLDLAYFMYASAPREVYDNLDNYLKIYHDSLTKTVCDLGSNQNVVPTWAELKNQWKLYSKYGLIMAMLALKACLQETDEVQDIAEVVEANENNDLMAGFTKSIKNDDLYYQIITSVIRHMAANDFL